MDLLHLDNLLFSYPDQNNPNIQSIITSKQEFINLKSIPNESQVKRLKRGDFYKHQKLIHNILHLYDTLAIIADPGTGKVRLLARVPYSELCQVRCAPCAVTLPTVSYGSP